MFCGEINLPVGCGHVNEVALPQQDGPYVSEGPTFSLQPVRELRDSLGPTRSPLCNNSSTSKGLSGMDRR